MNVAKLSANTRMALNNNFGFPKGENGTIGAFVKVSKNIDKELKDAGASIPSDWFGQPTGELFTIRFPINSLGKISEIDGLVNLDAEQKINMKPIYTSGQERFRKEQIDNDLLKKQIEDARKQYQDAINQQKALNQKTELKPQTFLEKNKTNLLIVGALVLGYLAYKKFNK